MVVLNCIVAGVGELVSVEIELRETVGELKKKIKEGCPELIHFDADLLTLYLARWKSWLNSSHWVFPAPEVELIMEESMQLVDAARLDDSDCFHKNFVPERRDIHFLVELPDEEVIQDRISCLANIDDENQPDTSANIHSENRRKRWRELNDVLDKNKKVKLDNENFVSTGDLNAQWRAVKRVLDVNRFKQERKSIPDETFDFLAKYLQHAANAMSGYADPSTAECHHLIAPLLIMLCSLLDDVKLEVDVALESNDLHTKSHFDFVLTRDKTKICIVEGKKNDFVESRAQVLVGCEAVANREELGVVYGLVTDFMQWLLFRCDEDSISMDSSTLGSKSDVLDLSSLRDVCEMIHGALLNVDDKS